LLLFLFIYKQIIQFILTESCLLMAGGVEAGLLGRGGVILLWERPMLRGKVWLLFVPAPVVLFPGMFSFRPSAVRSIVELPLILCVETLK
jgi:hypothetical protein